MKTKNIGKRRTEYNRELKRIKATLTRFENLGYITEDAEKIIGKNLKPLTMEEKAPTPSEVKRLQRLDLLALKRIAIFEENPNTGEIESKWTGELREIRRKERERNETRAILKEARRIIKENAEEEEVYPEFAEKLKASVHQRGEKKTANVLQKQMPNETVSTRRSLRYWWKYLKWEEEI